MKRISFNAGELSPELCMRADMDAYHRGAKILINWDVSQTGTLKRRRGMLPFVDALERSRLVPYVYSNTGKERYLIEAGDDALRVVAPDSGAELARFGVDWGDAESLRWKQVNNLLIFTHPASPPQVLKREDGQWVFERFEFKSVPWRYTGYREKGEEILLLGNADGSYSVILPDSLPEVERQMEDGDLLRASWFTEQQEAFAYRSALLSGVQRVETLSWASSFATGAKLALRGDVSLAYYVCTKDLEAGDFVNGLNSPENYPDNFLKAENTSGFDGVTPISGLSEKKYTKNEKVVLRSGYWEYFTCVQGFSGGTDYVEGAVSPGDYPGHFVRGLAVGGALPCRGDWQFYCSGGWYGSYDVRRSYDGPGLEREWEARGASFSRLGAASNMLLTGTEAGEECYIRLFLRRSRYVDDALTNGFPDDICSNKLIVSAYKHDMLLRYMEMEEEEEGTIYNLQSTIWGDSPGGPRKEEGRTREVMASGWEHVSAIKIPFNGRRQVVDWSWGAFRPAYGFPLLCEVFNQRLVFASTTAQPQSVWMSKADDLNNFALGKEDDSALAVTLSTTSQNELCWLMAHSSRLLMGTADAEFILTAGNAAALTYATVRVESHGYVGSAAIPAIMAVDKVLYCERGGARLYQYGYDFQSDSYVSRDLTVFADHLLTRGGGIAGGCILRKPEARAVFALKDGTMALMTYNTLHEIHCWHRYETEGKVVSVAALPDGDGADLLFLIVEREDEGGTRDDLRGTIDGNSAGGSPQEGKGKIRRFIEVIRGSEEVYVDHDSRDYCSTLLTNALTSVEAKVQKAPVAAVQVCLSEETAVAGLEVSCDGIRWDRLDRNDRMLPAGWHNLIASGKWDYDTVVGLRVRGDRGMKVLAIQG